MDWRKAASQVLRALRGSRSQAAFSRRLGYRSNVACEWEAGRRLPTANEALRICARVGVDVEDALRGFAPAVTQPATTDGGYRVDRWLDALRGSTAIGTLAAHGGFSRYAVSRWLRGQAQPRLADFLALVEVITGRASDLVQRLVPIEQVEALHEVQRRRAAARRLAFDAPWSEAVMRVLESTGYRKLPRHQPGYIASRLGIELEQEGAALSALEAAGVLQREGPRYGELRPLTVDTTHAEANDVARLREHWTRVSLARLPAPHAPDWFGYNVFSTTDADLERIREVLRAAYREVRAIAAASDPSESVALLNLQLLTWNEPR